MRLRRKKREVKPSFEGRRQGQLALDIRGIDKQSQKNILEALAREKADVFLIKGDHEPKLETAKFTPGEKKVYDEVLKMHAALMVQIQNLDSGDEAIHSFALFLQDLAELGSSPRQHAHVYQSCFYQYAEALVGLIAQHWDVRAKENIKRIGRL